MNISPRETKKARGHYYCLLLFFFVIEMMTMMFSSIETLGQYNMFQSFQTKQKRRLIEIGNWNFVFSEIETINI